MSRESGANSPIAIDDVIARANPIYLSTRQPSSSLADEGPASATYFSSSIVSAESPQTLSQTHSNMVIGIKVVRERVRGHPATKREGVVPYQSQMERPDGTAERRQVESQRRVGRREAGGGRGSRDGTQDVEGRGRSRFSKRCRLGSCSLTGRAAVPRAMNERWGDSVQREDRSKERRRGRGE
jgi:hypothetical protein